MRRIVILLFLITFAVCGRASSWMPDSLGIGFEKRYVTLADDYLGNERCTIVRYLSPLATGRGVLYIHGYNDYFFQAPEARQFAAHGYDFYAVDLRRYGRSLMPGQKPFVVRSLTEYFADIDSTLAEMRRGGVRDVVLMGHSTGGLLAAYYMELAPQPEIKAVILNSPFLDWNLGWKERLVPMLSWLGKWFPTMHISTGGAGVYAQSMESSAHGRWVYNHAWKSTDYGVDIGWFRAITEAQKYLRRHPRAIHVPLLLLSSKRSLNPKDWTPEASKADVVLDVHDIRSIGSTLGTDVTSAAVDGGLHDLFLSSPEITASLYKYIFWWLKKNN